MERTTRYSKKRQAILEVIRGTSVHPTADWIYQQLKPSHPDLSLGTVYRNLSLFREQGVVKSVGVVDGQERFDADLSPHSHFICTQCGAVFDLHTMALDKGLDDTVEEQYGHHVSHHDLTFRGVCHTCCKKRSKQDTANGISY